MRLEEPVQYKFILPAVTRLTGGPAAIVTYGEEMRQKGAEVEFVIPASPWHKEPIFSWTENIKPIYHERKTLRWSIPIALFKLLMRAMRTRIGRQTLRTILRIIMSWLVSRVLKKPYSTYMALLQAVRQIIPFIDLPSSSENDILIATLWPTALIACLSPSSNRIYMMQHYEEVFYPDNDEYSLVRVLVRLSYDLPMVRSANSSWLANKLFEVHGVGCDLVHVNGLVEEFVGTDIAADVKIESQPEETIKIIAYIRPEPWKGFASVIRAIEILRGEFNLNVALHTFGYLSPHWDNLKNKGLFEHHSGLSYEGLIDLIRSCDISITGSWYESFPAMPLEAMACKVPVICTAEGTEEFARSEETAILFQKNDEHDLALAVLKLLNCDSTALVSRAHLETRNFSWEIAHNARTAWMLDWTNLPLKKFPKKIRIRRLSTIQEPPRKILKSSKMMVVFDENGHYFALQDGVARHLHNPADVSRAVRKSGSEASFHQFLEFCDYWFL